MATSSSSATVIPDAPGSNADADSDSDSIDRWYFADAWEDEFTDEIILEEWVENFKAILKKEFDYVDDGLYPPFTPLQIFVMSVLSHPLEEHDLGDDFLLAIELVFSCLSSGSPTQAEGRARVDVGLAAELSDIHSPIRYYPDMGFYDVSPDCRYGVLHPRETPTQPFPFLKLPSELRLQIYKLVLTFDTDLDGFNIRPARCRSCPHVTHHQGPRAFRAIVNGRYCENVSPHEILSVLSVNRQIFEEAKGIFYLANDFSFDGVRDLNSFLSGIGPERRRFLRSVGTIYQGESTFALESKLAPKAFTLLAEAQNLQFLGLYLDEEAIFENPSNRAKHPKDIPGLWLLRKFRGLQYVDISGPRIGAYLEKEMVKPKSGDRASRALLKRRR